MNFSNVSENDDFDLKGLPSITRLKPTSTRELKGFGLLGEESLKIVNSMDELRKGVPNMVIAQCKQNVKFIQNQYRIQEFRKKCQYVMSLGVYNQLKYDPYRQITVLTPGTMKFKNLYRPYKGQDLNYKTILIWRTGGIGDLLFIQPNIRFIKEKYPSCHVKFACGPQYYPLVNNWDCIDELLDLPFNVSHMLKSDYHAIFEGVIERTKESHNINAYQLFSKWLNLDVPIEKLYPIVKAKDDKVKEVSKILKTWGLSAKNYIVLQIRASSPIRTPSPKWWKKVIDFLNANGYATVITDSPHRGPFIDEFIKKLANPRMNFNFAIKSKTLDLTIALVYLSKMALSTDSALSHISPGLGIPYYGIYGPFPGRIRLSTYKRVRWTDGNAECKYCCTHGHKSCRNSNPDGSSLCYDTIDHIELVNDIIDFMKSDDFTE